MSTDDLARVLGHLDRSGRCWNWTRATDKDGYGKTAVDRGTKHVRVHRYIYQALVAPIPTGLVIDHLCKNKRCANPDHLEVVTVRENTARGVAWEFNRSKRECVNGHSLTDALRKPDGRRECRECARLRAFRYRSAEPRSRTRPYVGRRRAMSNAQAQAITKDVA